MTKQLIASITSEAQPQSGQKHRSSGNFSTESAPSGTHKLTWVVTPLDGSPADGIYLDVMKDVTAGRDTTEWSGIRSDQQTDYKAFRNVYIANPSGASGKFTVSVYAVSG